MQSVRQGRFHAERGNEQGKLKDLLPVLTVLFVLLCGAFALAVGVVVLATGSCSPTGRQVGAVLVYEVDPEFTPDSRRFDIQALVGAIDRRVNSRRHATARVRQLDGRRIEIGLFGDDPKITARVERLLERPGTLEFRILANKHDHGPLIERARREDAGVLEDAEGNVEAWWVPIHDPDTLEDLPYPGMVPNREIIKRNRKRGGHRITEALVVNDMFDVTGALLDRAEPGKDVFGRPCVSLVFDSTGAPLLGALTGENLPDAIQDFTRSLGIIVDGELYSAPAIQNAVFERAQITGSFTRDEMQELVDLLNAGPLPAPIRQVEKRRAGAQQ